MLLWRMGARGHQRKEQLQWQLQGFRLDCPRLRPTGAELKDLVSGEGLIAQATYTLRVRDWEMGTRRTQENVEHRKGSVVVVTGANKARVNSINLRSLQYFRRVWDYALSICWPSVPLSS